MASQIVDAGPARISTNLSVDRQTPKRDFGDRLKAGLDSAAGVVASGASVAAPLLPAGSVISAAVASTQTGDTLPTRGVGSQYVTAGSFAPMSTTVAGTNGISHASVSTASGATSVPTGSAGTGTPTGSTTTGGTGGVDIASMQAENARLLQLQMSMQRENQVFTSVSNILKTRHESAKNSIQNIR